MTQNLHRQVCGLTCSIAATAAVVPFFRLRREVLRPQPLFEYKTGAMLNVINGKELPAPKAKRVLHPGIEPCIAVRHREFKWLAGSDIVYR